MHRGRPFRHSQPPYNIAIKERKLYFKKTVRVIAVLTKCRTQSGYTKHPNYELKIRKPRGPTFLKITKR